MTRSPHARCLAASGAIVSLARVRRRRRWRDALRLVVIFFAGIGLAGVLVTAAHWLHWL